jgi:hypothetical protein
MGSAGMGRISRICLYNPAGQACRSISSSIYSSIQVQIKYRILIELTHEAKHAAHD